MRKVALVVIVELDEVPGTMHTAESARDVVRNVLHQRMPAYNPVVFYADVVNHKPEQKIEGNV